MNVNIRLLPNRFAPGEEVDSLQLRRIVGRCTDVTVPVGCRFTIPPHMKKICISEQCGGIWIDRFFLDLAETKKVSNTLIPIYMKVYEEDVGVVLLCLKGIQYALNMLTGETSFVEPLKDIVLSAIHHEVEHDQDPVADAIQDYMSLRPATLVTNDEVVGFSNEEDTRLAGYPWDICNFNSKEMLVEMKNHQIHAPTRYLNSLQDLYLNVQATKGIGPSIYSELVSTFDPYLPYTFSRSGFDKLSQKCIENPCLTRKEILTGIGINRSLGDTTLRKNEEKVAESVGDFSTEILKLCVWLHQSAFSELIFRTILLYQEAPRFRLIHAVTRTRCGVDLALFQLELKSVLWSWNGTKYKELIVSKTQDEEVFLEIIGVDPKDTQMLHIDLFMTTLMSQALVRTNLDLSKGGHACSPCLVQN